LAHFEGLDLDFAARFRMMSQEKQNGILNQAHNRLFGERSFHVFNGAVKTPRQSKRPAEIDINESAEQRRNLCWPTLDAEFLSSGAEPWTQPSATQNGVNGILVFWHRLLLRNK
jgi:hypothetical protein